MSVLLGLLLLAMACILSLYSQNWLWLIVGVALAAMVVVWTFTIGWLHRAWFRPRPTWRCTRCNYDRRGLEHGARCPECGQPG